VTSRWADFEPSCAILLGSGWSEAVSNFSIGDSINYSDIPGLGDTGVKGHAGLLCRAEYAGLSTLIFKGRRHWYEGAGWDPIALPVYIMKKMQVRTLVISTSVGAINPDLKVGDIMLVKDHINLMGVNPLNGKHNPVWGDMFPDMSRIYNKELREFFQKASAKCGSDLKEGVLCACAGPAYETPAEIQMLDRLGADVASMSTVPEALLAHAAGLRIAGLSCITNYAAGRNTKTLCHAEVLETTSRVMKDLRALLESFFTELSTEE